VTAPVPVRASLAGHLEIVEEPVHHPALPGLVGERLAHDPAGQLGRQRPDLGAQRGQRLLPFGLMGFGINFITGMFFFIAASEQYTQNVAFHYKVVLLMLAGVSYLVLTVYDEAWALPASLAWLFACALVSAPE